MKRILMFSTMAALFSMSVITSCKKAELERLAPVATTSASEVSERAAPTISTVTGDVKGYYWCGNNHWEAYYAADYHSSWQRTFTITGANFGTVAGTVSLVDATGYAISLVTNGWSNAQIKVIIRPTSTGVQPTTTLKVKVSKPNNGGSTTSASVKVVPYAVSRQWHQCTWWATVRRLDSGLSVQSVGNSYLTSYKDMNADYVPKSGDIQMWFYYATVNGKTETFGHQAYVESVTTTPTYNPAGQPAGTIDYKYAMTISQYNISCESYSSYSRTVTVRKAPNGTKTILSGDYKHPDLGASYNNGYKKYWPS